MTNTIEGAVAVAEVEAAGGRETVGLEQYYSEAGPDYAAWRKAFNMHFGYFRWGMNPFRREAMLERMNGEVANRLGLRPDAAAEVLDLGCGLGATLRSFAKRLPLARLTGMTLVPWQVEQARALNEEAGQGERVRVMLGDYEQTTIPAGSFDAVYALESSCHAHGEDKQGLLKEMYRLLKPGGRMVVVDGFLTGREQPKGLQGAIYRKLCECWVIEDLGRLALFVQELERAGFESVVAEYVQGRVTPSVLHIPWVTIKFLLTDVVFGKRRMTQARWNNVIAPVLLPMVGYPVGPMRYCMVSATKPAARDAQAG